MQALAKVSSVKVDTVQQEDDRFDPLSLASPGSASDVVPVSTGFPVSPKWYSEDKQKSMMSAPAYNHALDAPTLHGDSAALRRAVTELLFFASVGDLTRCRRIVTLWNLKVDDPTQCCDYDKRTPMHLAACEGACAVTEWLIESGADINAIDRFNRTPLDEAVRSNRPEIVQLLAKANAKVFEKGKLVPLTKSELADHGTRMLIPDPEYDTWEIDPDDLCLHEKLGEDNSPCSFSFPALSPSPPSSSSSLLFPYFLPHSADSPQVLGRPLGTTGVVGVVVACQSPSLKGL